MFRISMVWLFIVGCLSLSTTTSMADEETSPFDNLEFRCVGPVNMSGRVTDVEGVPGNPNVVYVAAASGGVWKTENGGHTFLPMFDDQPIASIGDLGVSLSNPDVVYVGSGESNARNSVSFGNGVYKSTDGGASWKHVGLRDSRHISRVLVHPENPDIVYVGALGHLFGPNDTRGVYRSKDGGRSWERVLHIDDKHGVSDMDMDPSNPNILYAGLWHFDRKPWTHVSGSEEGGVWRSVDGGNTWEKLTDGLPSLMGRIGVKVAPSRPKTVYVIAESNEGVLFRSNDRGEKFEKVSDNVQIVSRGLYYTDMRVDPQDHNRLYAVSSRLFRSVDGGKNFERIARTVHVDFHAMWIDPQNPDRIWIGEDGGVAVSYDRGDSWEPIRNLPIGQFYQIFADNREPFYYLGGGLQDNGSWLGPSRTREVAGIYPDDWRMFSFGDAYFIVPHPEQEGLYLSEYQGGAIMRTDTRTGQQLDVSPQPRRNDGGPVGELTYRFNWNAPIIQSVHDPNTVYFAGNVVFKTRDFGDNWTKISPDLTTNDPKKQGDAGGPVWFENTTAEYHCTIISFAESPVDHDILWAGTDDGRLQVTRDGGQNWTDVSKRVGGVPEFSPVSHVEPSSKGPGVAYATFDRHMFDDYAPHVYKTTDFGETWSRITQGLPNDGWVWVLREDPRNSEVLWLGTELGLYLSYDAGKQWERRHLSNLPTVAVHDLLIHPRENDLIVGTHGRAIWVFDDATPLQEFGVARDKDGAHLFGVRPALRFPTTFSRYGLGDKAHRAANPPPGALITYSLAESVKQDDEKKEPRLTLEILNDRGEVIRTLDKVGLEQGLNRVAWDLTEQGPKLRKASDAIASDFSSAPRGPYVLPGVYKARLRVDETVLETDIVVKVDPKVQVTKEALTVQHAIAKRLSEMTGELNGALRSLDSTKAQLASRRGTAKALEISLDGETGTALSEFETSLDTLSQTLTRAEGKPFWSQGPRLSERLASLFGNIDSQFAEPTKAQHTLFDELSKEFSEAQERVGQFFDEDLPTVNKALSEAGLPPLATTRRVDT